MADNKEQRHCPLCDGPITFTDEESGYEYCVPCQWRGPTEPDDIKSAEAFAERAWSGNS